MRFRIRPILLILLILLVSILPRVLPAALAGEGTAVQCVKDAIQGQLLPGDDLGVVLNSRTGLRALYDSLWIRSRGPSDPDGNEMLLHFPLPEAAEAVDFAQRALLQFKENIAALHPNLDLSELEKTVSSLQSLKDAGYPYEETLRALDRYSEIATAALDAESRRGPITGFALLNKQGLFFRSSWMGAYFIVPNNRFVVPVSRDLDLLAFVRASPYPIDFVGVTNEMKHVDAIDMNPIDFHRHDWFHKTSRREQMRVLNLTEAQAREKMPFWEENVDRFFADLNQIPDEEHRKAAILLAFHITHEDGFPPSAEYFGSRGKSAMVQSIMSLMKQTQGRFYGPGYENVNAIDLDWAWDWLTRRFK